MMKTETDSWPGRTALLVAHCAGMVDLIALPVWVGTLIARFQLDPQQAGGLATLFLLGAVASSLFFAARFDRMRGRVAAPLGFLLAGLAFLAVPLAAASTSPYVAMAALHVLAGLSAGCALSFTHGTIGRSIQPHRLFAYAGLALGVFAIAFLGGTPQLVAALGGPALFHVFGGVMLLSALVCALAFPRVPMAATTTGGASVSALPAPVWFAIAGVACMSLVQAMTFSFVERMGADRGFGVDAVTGVFIALGFLNLLPPVLAAALERRLHARGVLVAGPLVQAAIVLLITQSAGFAPYAAGTVVFTAVMIFTHTFAFGLLARLDPTGRAVAATPAMLMVGSGIGPLLGGTLVKLQGYDSLGLAAGVVAVVAVLCFARATTRGAGAWSADAAA